MAETILQLAGLGLDGRLAELDLDLQGGQLVALLGPNGAGKSSLLKLISGELASAAGEPQFGGRALGQWPAAELARQLASLGQQSPLNFPYLAREVVELGRTPHASGRRRDRDICRAALAATDCEALAERFYTELSGGEKQRVQLARILAQLWPGEQELGLMLLDEPTASLDLAHQRQLLDYCRQWLGPRRSVVVAMHDINLALRYADRILILKQGQLLADGSPAEIAEPALLGQIFGVAVAIAERPDGGGPWVLW